MKRVLRSCLEPLPRSLSIRGLAIVVVMLLTGTGLSVYEYLESTQPLGRPSAERSFLLEREVQAAERELPRRPAQASAGPVSRGAAPGAAVEDGAGPAADALWSGYPAVGSSPAAGVAEPTSSPAFWEPSEVRVGG